MPSLIRTPPGRRAIVLIMSAMALGAACAAPGPAATPTSTLQPTPTLAPTASPTLAPTASATAMATATGAPTASAAPTMGGLTLDVATSTHGDHLVDPEGMSLYIFTNDSPGTTTCMGDCLANWPALTVEAGGSAVAGTGVTGELGTITRPDDGTTQVTINDMPLYYFIGDTAAGDVNGQGLQGIWFLAAPAGGGVGAEPTGSPTSGGDDASAPAEDPYGDY